MLCRLGLELADHRLIATRFGFNGVNPADQGFAYALLVLLTQGGQSRLALLGRGCLSQPFDEAL